MSLTQNQTRSSNWLRPFSRARPSAAGRILVCFPYGGGSAGAFRNLSNVLSEDADVWVLKMPGREERSGEPAPTAIGTIVEAVVEELRHFDRPFLFYGHSLGAGLALEVAHVLDRLGRATPDQLILSGRMPPHVKYSSLLIEMSDDELWEYIRAESLLDLPSDSSSPFARMALKLLQGDLDLNAQLTYQFIKPLPIPLDVINGIDDPLIDTARVDEWARYTSVRFRSHLLPGGHFYFRSDTDGYHEMVRSILRTAA